MKIINIALGICVGVTLAGHSASAQATPQSSKDTISKAQEAAPIENGGSYHLGNPDNKGYCGISFGGSVALGATDGRMWSDYPVIRKIDPGSPGEKAGLMAGDSIIAVNSIDARKGGFFDGRKPGITYTVRVRRDGELHEYVFVTTTRPGTHQ